MSTLAMVTAGGTHRALLSLLPSAFSCDNCEADSITLKFGRAKETHVGLQLSLSELGLPMAGTVPTCHYNVNGSHRVWLGTRRPCSSHDTCCLLNELHPESSSRSSKIVRVFKFHGISKVNSLFHEVFLCCIPQSSNFPFMSCYRTRPEVSLHRPLKGPLPHTSQAFYKCITKNSWVNQ